MIIQAQVGPQNGAASLGAGLTPALRLDNVGALVNSQLHGRYFESARNRRIFTAANQTVTTTTVGLTTTYTGLCLSNPVGSGWNLSILGVGYSAIVAWPAGSAIFLAGGNTGVNVTHTTAVTPRCLSLSASPPTPVGLADVAATVPVGYYLIGLGQGLTGAITTEVTGGQTWTDLGGAVVLEPGGFAYIATSTVSGTNGFWGSITWEEIPA